MRLDPGNIHAWSALGDLYSDGDPAVRNAARALQAYTRAAAGGDINAMFALAPMLGPNEFPRAKQMLETVIAAGGATEVPAWLALGDLYVDALPAYRNPAAAEEAYRQVANAGNTAGIIKLARLVGYGDQGVPADFERARRLLQLAIDRGAASWGWSTLGDLYINGPEANQDVAKGVEAYNTAAKLGDVGAMIKLARVVGPGSGVPADFALAKSWLDKAIAANDPGTLAWAQTTLGNLYASDETGNKDPEAAAAAYEKAVDLGDTGAMIALGRMLGFGDGIPADVPRAEELLTRAARVGDGNAAYAWTSLGDVYRDGDTRPLNMARAADAYDQAANLGGTAAMINLARILGNGDGVDVDFAKAVALLKRAIAANDGTATWAWTTLGGLYGADGENQDVAKAVEAYRHAAGTGDIAATLALAGLLANNDPVDFDAAKRLLETVIAAGGDTEMIAWGRLGDLYAFADEPNADLAKAVDAYRHAIGGGDVSAMIKLARLLAQELSGFAEAEGLLQKAAAASDGNQTWAWATLGDLYRDAGAGNADPAKAVAAYMKAADAGDPGAMIKLANMIAAGEGAPSDFGVARDLLLKAVAQGGNTAPWAWSTLGDLYRTAEGDDANPAEAVAAYQQAVEGGDTGAMIKLARMIIAGDGIETDNAAARMLLEQAAEAGDGNRNWALTSLADLYRREGDIDTALKLYETAGATGDAYANLAAGITDSYARPASAERQAALVRNYRRAAEASGVDVVAKEMYNLPTNALYYTVQVFLSAITPERLLADGILRAAIDRGGAEVLRGEQPRL